MRTLKAIVIMAIMLFATTVQAGMLEDIIFGQPKPAETLSVSDPIGMVIGLSAGGDFHQDNDYQINLGAQINQIEIGAKAYLWPDDSDNYGIYALRHLTHDNILIGVPFLGFEATIDGEMYAFLSGFDTEIEKNFILRTSVGFRNFADALAVTHNDESDEITGGISVVMRF